MYNINSSIEKSFKNGQFEAASAPTRFARRQPPEPSNGPQHDFIGLSPLYFPFLKGIKDHELKTISSHVVQQKFHKKEYIYLPYGNNDKVYFIINGNVELGYLDESGRELSIDILGRGEIFGSFLGRHFTGGFARALDNTILAILSREDFESFLERHPRFSLRIMKIMSNRINVLETKLQNLVFSDVRTRICKLLCSLYQKAGDSRTGRIKIPLTHQDIANLVASSRETASLHLSELKKRGTIAYERRRIRILSLPDLEQCSSCA